MSDELVQKLAIAYAQVKLAQEQQDDSNRSGTNEEIRSFLKWYHFAVVHIPEENKEIDLSTLA